MPEAIIDASAMVDLLVGSALAGDVAERLRGHQLHAPGHFDAEVLSAIGRLQRADLLPVRQATSRVRSLAAAPINRHMVSGLVEGAWRLRHNLRLVDALYVELGTQLDLVIITTDSGMAQATARAELVASES